MILREKLVSKRANHKEINMEWVYDELDKGRTVKSLAQELGVSETTLRRRHKEYQEKARELILQEDQEKEKPYYDYTF
ncbi:transposase family protein [Eubacterium ventriosum]|uniref:transposase family protein n=1 Tax=Eubacterium ventriosum TaxID=39496 RepID=UPI003AB28DB6